MYCQISIIRLKAILFLFLVCFLTPLFALEVPIYDFPLAQYSQEVADYFPTDNPEYKALLFSNEEQKAKLKEFYRHYFQSNSTGLSPWSESYVKAVLETLKEKEIETVKEYDNTGKDLLERHYGENFKEHNSAWLTKIIINMNLSKLEGARFNKQSRAIVISNTLARTLPEIAPDFYHFSKAGEGFPFDTLQGSALWIGTPLYVVNTTKDGHWALVITPDQYFAWVKSEDFAYVSQSFINRWQDAAKKTLVATTKTDASLSTQNNEFISSAYIGSVFPLQSEASRFFVIYLPHKVGNTAVIKKAKISKKQASKMPILATEENFAKLISELKGRPYGWGGSFFFNDCSQELKSLFAPFAIWLPRNSASQAEVGKKLDLSDKTVNERLRILKEEGKPLLTLIRLNGHIMLYLGVQKFGRFKGDAITYQNIWGVAPISRDKRYVIGQSLFLPLLKFYPEAPDAVSLVDKSNFQLIFIDE